MGSSTRCSRARWTPRASIERTERNRRAFREKKKKKTTDATRLQQLPRAVKHPLVAPEEQRRAALQPRRDRVHGPAIRPRVVPHQRLHERRREPRALRRARQASQRRLRVEGPFKATNVGVKFRGVRSGVDRRRGASGL
eukprot:31510-Pelagococcus_subviridis.AAC.30